MKYTKLILIVLAIALTGCTENLHDGPIATMPCNNVDLMVDVLLHPAVDADNPTKILNNTYYDIFIGGKYVGNWTPKQDGVVNASELNLTNKSDFRVTSLEYLSLLVHSPGYYNKGIQAHLNCGDIAVRIIPELVKLKPVNFIVIDEQYREEINGSISVYPFETLRDIEVKKRSLDHFGYLCCDYDRYDIESVDMYNDWSYEYYETEYVNSKYGTTCRSHKYYDIDDEFEFLITPKHFDNTTTISCQFMDKDAFINRHGKIVEGFVDDDGIDLGAPNKGFEITLKMEG